MIKRLRLALLSDAPRLFAWRNDESTRMASHNSAFISLASHLAWLELAIASPRRKLYIYEESRLPCATLRADLCPEGDWQLSWTVAPDKRGRGIAKNMVALMVANSNLHFCAQIKKENLASAKVAEFVGMRLEKECEGILYYYK